MAKVIEVEKLVKKYNGLVAVDGISFYVKGGEVFGLLGENGAGKTTTLEIIEGIKKPTSGQIMVLGHNIKGGLRKIKQKIGVQLQSSAYYNFLTLREILELFGSYYDRWVNPDELLEMVGLKDKAKSYVVNLSGGQKQRFSIVASLVNDPKVVFLDEPTTGLDPLARRQLWEIVAKIKGYGKTIILTTHYMEEAETLCDRIAIMERGKILKMGETHELIESVSLPFTITFIAKNPDKAVLDKIKSCCELEAIFGKADHYILRLKTQAEVNEALGLIQKLSPEGLTVNRARLEDLFIEITGKAIEENGNDV